MKTRQAEVWGSAPWERVAETLAPLHDHLVAELSPRAGERWLDAATGTGAVAIRAARAGAELTGLDLAPRLVETAKRLAADEGLDIRFDVGDCEDLPYDDASFDVVASAVGVIFAPDHVAVARELARVCRPGGRLGLVSWQPNPAWSAVLEPFRLRPEPGAGDPDDWGRKEHVRDLLGYEFELRFVEGNHALQGESAEAIWELLTTAHGAFKALLESLDAPRRGQLHRAFVGYLEQYRADGGISAPDDYLLILGVRRGRAVTAKGRHQDALRGPERPQEGHG
ncbi:MAG TPA: class I SAM-dependent methyltransferase [Gaiellaceae bacterium]|nr:class I SAM-dependent methyltransferase [Gaiellaceae bacterium]